MWKKGRQNSGYKIITLINRKINLFKLYGFDSYIIKYNKGHFIPPHKDLVKFGRHYRINIILFNSNKEGGKFICEEYKTYFFKRIILFRPDLCEHSVSECDGNRVILSIGWLLK